MTPCPEPYLVPNPDDASSQEINVERVSVAQWGACYKLKFNGLVQFYRDRSNRDRPPAK